MMSGYKNVSHLKTHISGQMPQTCHILVCDDENKGRAFKDINLKIGHKIKYYGQTEKHTK